MKSRDGKTIIPKKRRLEVSMPPDQSASLDLNIYGEMPICLSISR